MDTVVTSMTSTESQLKDLENKHYNYNVLLNKKRKKSCTRSCSTKQAEQAAKDAQAQPAQAVAPAQPATPANNGGQAQKKNLKRRA